MTTAREVIEDALDNLAVLDSEEGVQAAEFEAARRRLNDLMFALSADGIALGFTEVTSTSSVMTVPRGALAAIKALLARELAPVYNVQISDALKLSIARGMTTLTNLTAGVGESAYPDTLPVGSGNYNGTLGNNTFYPDEEDTILDETGGSINLEENTE